MYYCTLCKTAYDDTMVHSLPKIKLKGHPSGGRVMCPKRGCGGVILDIDEMMIPIIDRLYYEFGVVSLFCCSGHWFEQHSNPYIMIKFDEENELCKFLLNDSKNDKTDVSTGPRSIASEYGIRIDYDEEDRNSLYIGCDNEEYYVKRSITLRLPHRSLDMVIDDINNTVSQFNTDIQQDNTDPYMIRIKARSKLWEQLLNDHMNLCKYLDIVSLDLCYNNAESESTDND